MPTIEANGTQLEYVERGAGDPVVLVHGTLGDLRSWEPQMDLFSEHHRVVSYSRRHHHPNPCRSDGTDYSATLHADDLAAFMTGLGLGAAHIVGNSYGAYTALLLAARHPERVRSLVLGEPPILPLLENQSEGRALRATFLAEVWEPTRACSAGGRLEDGLRTFVDGLFGEGAFLELPREVHDLIMDNVCEFTLEVTSADFWTSFSCDDAARIATPTLLLSGDQSLRMFELIVNELERCLPNNERVHVPGSSHDLPAHQPDVYNNTVLDFLATHAW